jgi:Lon protease-like protein
MSDDASPLADFAGTARLFPLPNLVLFPQVVQGLHVFEPRYRQMVTDALAGDHLIALVLLHAGWEADYDDAPAIESVACLGKVTWHETLPDGRYNLRLRGLARVRILEELPTDRLYRTARVEAIPDINPTGLTESRRLRQGLADAVLPRFEAEGPARRQLQELFEGELPLGHVCDVLAYALPLPVEFKQAMLAEPRADRRAAALVDAILASAARAARKFPPDFSPN